MAKTALVDNTMGSIVLCGYAPCPPTPFIIILSGLLSLWSLTTWGASSDNLFQVKTDKLDLTFSQQGALPTEWKACSPTCLNAVKQKTARFDTESLSLQQLELLIEENPELAEIVVGALHHFRGERYQLYSWCVMPNHVHVIFKPFEQFELNSVVHSWKRFSSRQINIAMGRTGELWQREYYDRLIRDEDELERAINYVIENPGKAGLKNWRWMDVGV